MFVLFKVWEDCPFSKGVRSFIYIKIFNSENIIVIIDKIIIINIIVIIDKIVILDIIDILEISIIRAVGRSTAVTILESRDYPRDNPPPLNFEFSRNVLIIFVYIVKL